MLRFLDAGESHGKALVAIIDGFPAGLKVNIDLINKNLMLRQSGYGRGGRQKIERDKVEFLSGVRSMETIGSPITILINNRDFENWQPIMAYDAERTGKRRVTSPRPGHADLTGYLKYDREDIRDVLERSSARETAARVAVGSLCECALRELGVRLISFVCSIGGIRAQIDENDPELNEKIEKSPVFCPDERATDMMIARIEEAKRNGDTVGGSVEVIARGVVPGLGSYSFWDRKLDARIAAAIMSIQAVKACEIGEGINSSNMYGSEVHDEIERTGEGYRRKTNRAGGIEGGMSNGENIVIKAYMKPIPTLRRGLSSVDVVTKQTTVSAFERSDVCAVPALSIIAKSVVAFELLGAYLEKFGSDTIRELKERVEAYRLYLQTK